MEGQVFGPCPTYTIAFPLDGPSGFAATVTSIVPNGDVFEVVYPQLAATIPDGYYTLVFSNSKPER